MRVFALVTMLLVAFVSPILLTAIAALCSLSVDDYVALQPHGFCQGHMMSFLTSRVVWSKYPALPHLTVLISGRAMTLTLPAIVGVFLLTRPRKQHALPVRVVALTGIALLPYAAGALVLHANSIPELAGPWLLAMLLGPLYAMATIAVLCATELRRPLNWHLAIQPTAAP
jgi:hypothetical protein